MGFREISEIAVSYSSALREGAARGKFCLQKITRKFISEEEGQGTVEYMLLIGFCIVGASQIARGILNVLDQGILKLGGQLEKDLKTGRAPLNAWRN